MTKAMLIRLPYADDPDALQKVEGLGRVLKRYKGPCPVYLSVRDPAGRAAQFKLPGDYSVNPVEVKVDELELLFGPGTVIFTR